MMITERGATLMSLHAMLSRSAHVSLRQGQLCVSGDPPRSLPIEDLDTLTLEDGGITVTEQCLCRHMVRCVCCESPSGNTPRCGFSAVTQPLTLILTMKKRRSSRFEDRRFSFLGKQNLADALQRQRQRRYRLYHSEIN